MSSYNSTTCSRRRGSYDDKHVSKIVKILGDDLPRAWLSMLVCLRWLQSPLDVSVRDFHLMKTIGKGAFGKVLLVQCRRTGQFYAMKVMNKKSIVAHNNVKGVVNEKRIMQCVSFPFLVTLHNSFKVTFNTLFNTPNLKVQNGSGDIAEKLFRKLIGVYFRILLQDSMNLYMIMEFVSGGDLFFHLRRKVFFP